MQDNVRRQGAPHRSGSSSSMAAVSLPTGRQLLLPPGSAQRQLPPASARPPTPPPRPESTFRTTTPSSSGGQASSRLLPPAMDSLASAAGVSGGGRNGVSSSQQAATPLRPLLPLPSLLSLSDSLPAVVGVSSLPPPAAVISLTSPRTPAVRQQNLYVEAPVKKKVSSPSPGAISPLQGVGSLRLSSSSSCQSVQSAVNNNPNNNNNNKQQRPGRLGIAAANKHNSSKSAAVVPLHSSPAISPLSPVSSSSLQSVIISQQPPLGGSSGGGTLKKCTTATDSSPPSTTTTLSESASSPTLSSSSSGGGGTDSIICSECGRCRCAACRSPRPLPSAWLCDNSCLCSPESVVDMVSCMCCVKAGLYHCGEGLEEEASWVDNPCSCTPNQWLLRWGCLAALSLPLPCLLCYPLLSGLTGLAESCYQRATGQGCRCSQPPPAPLPTAAAVITASSPGADSQKRLLG